MYAVSPNAPIRIARPTRDLEASERFWVGGVGLEVLWRTEEVGEGEHHLLMVGAAGARWHLELVDDPAAAHDSRPGPEDLLVVYLGDRPDDGWLGRIREHGGTTVPARNPYWDEWGVTVRDPDGYLLVLSHRRWG